MSSTYWSCPVCDTTFNVVVNAVPKGLARNKPSYTSCATCGLSGSCGVCPIDPVQRKFIGSAGCRYHAPMGEFMQP